MALLLALLGPVSAALAEVVVALPEPAGAVGDPPSESRDRAQFSRALAAFRAATSLEQRYETARQVAAVRYAQGKLLAAQSWLRRAANYAPSREAADRNRADFRAIRAETPFRPTFSFSVTPSDNINNGVENRIFSLGDILLVFPTSELALSGIEYAARAGASYTFSQSETHRTALDASLFGRTYTLSQEAKRRAPDVRGRDYGLVQLAVGVSHARQLQPGWGVSEARLSAGQIWSGGEALRRFARVDLSQQILLPGPQSAHLSAFVEPQFPIAEGQPEATLWGARAAYHRQLPWSDRVQVSFETSLYDADIATYAYRANRLQARYDVAEPVMSLGLSFSAALSHKTYDEFSLSLDGRRDRQVELGATAVFNEVTLFGFSPSVTATAQRTWSNVDRFDTEGVSVGFGFASRF